MNKVKSKWKTALLSLTVAGAALLAVAPGSSALAQRSEDVEGGGGGGYTPPRTTSTTTTQTLNDIPALYQEASWQSSNGGRYMNTRATLQRSGPLAGQLDATTRTKNSVKLTGFTGGVFILLKNSDGAVIGATEQKKFGVDGTWIGRYDRTDYWSAYFPADVAGATASMEIIQQHAAKDLDDQLAYWHDTVCRNTKLYGLTLPIGCTQ
ncbi:hypothetical protein [Paenibacillus mucilaginosus]|uniref:Uncharacterized protein n=1 Tax=Paenibacillus mucilaginosus (strain KNP414) TaxID=1036673 RepID=F8FIW9_PAEMK|nr:hypothetical protein [Paenibacillus mucilaginosus]AEI46347.1 hypothetical protein KNP414_07862 [Paenibacillus mucilaginosus KNP414]MCG7213539.1 hypothetical protein [Paenibacillus mucilaginosus]WDM27645.1 hypothetical protein KCX80_35810 [Paenibacillus mucilaginosus]